MSERGIDCSGLVHMAWRRLGRIVPRDADQQAEAAQKVDEPRYGDLAVYGRESVTHIAFWLGEGRILHAAGSREVVEERSRRPCGRFAEVSSGSIPPSIYLIRAKGGCEVGRYRGRGRC